MVRTIIKPDAPRINLSIPTEYIGEEIVKIEPKRHCLFRHSYNIKKLTGRIYIYA